jgi:hypothetical protein
VLPLEQMPLGPAFHYQDQAAKLRAILNRAIAANGLSHAELEHDTGIDEKQIGRCLREDGGAHLPLALLACILEKDRGSIVLSEMAKDRGFEVRPKLDPWERIRELEAQLARVRDAAGES